MYVKTRADALFTKNHRNIPKDLEKYLYWLPCGEDTLCLHFMSTYSNNSNIMLKSAYQFKIYVTYVVNKDKQSGLDFVEGVTLDFESNDLYKDNKLKRLRRVNKPLNDYIACERMVEFLISARPSLLKIIDEQII